MRSLSVSLKGLAVKKERGGVVGRVEGGGEEMRAGGEMKLVRKKTIRNSCSDGGANQR